MYKLSDANMGVLAYWAERAARKKTFDEEDLLRLTTDLGYILDTTVDLQDRKWEDRPARKEFTPTCSECGATYTNVGGHRPDCSEGEVKNR